MKTTIVPFPDHSSEMSSLSRDLEMLSGNDQRWKNGKLFGYVFNPGEPVVSFLEKTYMEFAHMNRLSQSCFPSLRAMETEIVSMCANLLHGDEHVTGSVTSGGTESIIMSVLVAREIARDKRNRGFKPELILPVTAHPAFLKACHYLDVTPRIIPVTEDKRADFNKMEEAINDQTIMLVASAPCFPFGVVDPVEKIAMIAGKHKLLLHVDACMGGFMLPFMEVAGYPVPEFDFLLPGVTSISLDAHKFGYAMKGASIILYRHHDMRKKQFFVTTNWPGGIFASTAMLGTRSGGPLACAWAMIKLLGKEGYVKMVREVMEAVQKLKAAIAEIPGLEIISNPDMSLIAIKSEEFDVFYIADLLEEKGWHLDRQQLPDSLHFTVSSGNTGVMDDFIFDLREVMHHTRKLKAENRVRKIALGIAERFSDAVGGKRIGKIAGLFRGNENKSHAKHTSGQAAFYGLTGHLPDREKVSDAVLELLDEMYS